MSKAGAGRPGLLATEAELKTGLLQNPGESARTLKAAYSEYCRTSGGVHVQGSGHEAQRIY